MLLLIYTLLIIHFYFNKLHVRFYYTSRLKEFESNVIICMRCYRTSLRFVLIQWRNSDVSTLNVKLRHTYFNKIVHDGMYIERYFTYIILFRCVGSNAMIGRHYDTARCPVSTLDFTHNVRSRSGNRFRRKHLSSDSN